jgi:hypothetical protein
MASLGIYSSLIRHQSLPNQIHGRVVIVEGNLQGPAVATVESNRDGFGEVDGLVGGLSPQTEDMSPGRNLDGFGVGAMNAIENDQVLLRTSMKGLSERQLVINP